MNKIKFLSVILLSVLVMLLFVSCDLQEDKASEVDGVYYSFTDSLGNEVTLTEKPERVAVLFSSLCNVWKNAGGEVYITVGESFERGFCDENTLLVDSGAGKTINTELLLSYEPDFVIYSSDVPAQKDCAALLEDAGITCAAIRLDSFEDYLYALDNFCSITGEEENYILYGEKQKEEINLIKEKALGKEESRILFVRSGSSASSFKAKKADDNFAAKMLQELGCFNIADKAEILLDGISAEVVLQENPEYIFISIMGDEEAGKKQTEEFFSLDAMKNLEGEIIYLPKELFQYKPCERWAEAYAFLYENLYG